MYIYIYILIYIYECIYNTLIIHAHVHHCSISVNVQLKVPMKHICTNNIHTDIYCMNTYKYKIHTNTEYFHPHIQSICMNIPVFLLYLHNDYSPNPHPNLNKHITFMSFSIHKHIHAPASECVLKPKQCEDV
jgi:hypothetical protein